MLTLHARHTFSLSLCVGIHFAAVTFLLPLLPNLGTTSPWFEAAFALAHILALPLMGHLADRFGTRPVLVVSLLGELCAFGLLAWSRSAEVILAARLLAGASSAILPVCFGWIRQQIPEGPLRQHSIAALMLSISFGATIGSITSGVLAAAPIWQAAGLGIGLSLLGILFLRNLEKSQQERSEPFPQRYRSVLLSRPLMTMALVFFTASTAFFLFRPLLPFQLETPLERGLFVGLLSFLSGLAQLPFLFRIPKKQHVLTGFLGALGCIVLSFALMFFLAPSAFILSVVGIAIGYGIADALGGLSLIGFTKKHHAAETTGIVFGIGALGKILGPSLAAIFVVNQLLTEGLLIATLFAGLSFLLILSLVIRCEDI